MSGHSKWSKIKRQKQAGDLKKGNLFTKLAQAIAIATREGGSGDPDMNFMLRIAIERAKEANMPKDNIKRAIKKGLGEGGSDPLESLTYEVVGRGGVAILVDCLTDNKKRTVSEIRKIASREGFGVGRGSMGWQFESKGNIVLEPFQKEKVVVKGKEVVKLKKMGKEALMLELMEIEGVEDVEGQKEDREVICILTSRDKFKDICRELERKNLKVLKAGIVKMAKNKLQISEENKRKIEELIGQLEECPDVTFTWSNVDSQ